MTVGMDSGISQVPTPLDVKVHWFMDCEIYVILYKYRLFVEFCIGKQVQMTVFRSA